MEVGQQVAWILARDDEGKPEALGVGEVLAYDLETLTVVVKEHYAVHRAWGPSNESAGSVYPKGASELYEVGQL